MNRLLALALAASLAGCATTPQPGAAPPDPRASTRPAPDAQNPGPPGQLPGNAGESSASPPPMDGGATPPPPPDAPEAMPSLDDRRQSGGPGRASVPGPAPGTTSGTCDAAKAQSAVGKPSSAAALETSRIAAGADTARVLKHNQPVTMEFREGRLNLVLDASGKVGRVTCG